MRRIWAGAVLAAVAVTAGCGGGGGSGSLPDGADIAPASSIGFVSVNTDFSSDQWRKVADLAGHFPGTPKLIQQFEKQTGLSLIDVEPALGPETNAVWLDARNNGDDVVVLTKPDSKEKLDTLLEKSRSKGEAESHALQVGDWVAISGSMALLERFKTASEGDNLSATTTSRMRSRSSTPTHLCAPGSAAISGRRPWTAASQRAAPRRG